MNLSLLSDFNFYARGSGILTLVLLILTIVAFLFKWGFRFRLVGATSFLTVLTVGLFTLSFSLFTYKAVPGAIPFSLVYDNGGNQVVIAIPPDVTPEVVEATLRQAVNDLYSYGRIGGEENEFTIRARTVTHPETGRSKPLYLGQIKRPLQQPGDEVKIDIFTENFAELN